MRPELYLLSATLLAGFGWVASKIVVQALPGELFLGLRFILAGLILLPFCYKSIVAMRVKPLLYCAAVGCILGVALQIWIVALSMDEGVTEGAFIMSLAMIFAPIVSWVMFRVKPNKAFWLAWPISIIGMMLLTLTDGWSIELSQAYFVLASVSLSIHFVLNKKLTANIKPLVSICIQLFFVGFVSLLVVSVTEQADFTWSTELILWFLLATILITSVRYLLQTMGQSAINMETAALIMILEPVWAMCFSYLVLDEWIELQKLFGASLILLSLFLYIKLSKKRAAIGLN